MSKPTRAALRALDLFCGAGAVSDGLTEAGFDVTGVDIKPQKRYPYRFIQADAVGLEINLAGFDFVWASPPCQRYSLGSRSRKGYLPDNYPDLIDPIRLKLAGHPFTCIENVPLAPLRPDLTLSGRSVGLHRIDRRRIFELSFFALSPGAPRLPRSMWESGRAITITKSMCAASHFYPRKLAGLPGRVSPAEAAEAMGIKRRMTSAEIGEAVPPAYAEFIARQAFMAGCGA
jgi:DNA (cytosine-5)-methyltransferase 1